MVPEIVDRDEFIVIGIRVVLDLSSDCANTLWRDKFMPRHGEIAGMDRLYYGVFNSLSDGKSAGRYEYVAGAACDSLENIPLGMVGWVVPAGRYAQAEATGLAGIPKTFRHLITDWLPDSDYSLAASPVFAYTDFQHPDSPEAIWKVNIPIETPEMLEQLKNWLGTGSA